MSWIMRARSVYWFIKENLITLSLLALAVYSFCRKDFSAGHLALAACAMAYSKRFSPQWKISAAYVGIYCAANILVVWSTKNGVDLGYWFYLAVIPFELAIIALCFWRHPLPKFLAVSAVACIFLHICSFLSYQVVPILHPVFRFLQSVHWFTIPIIELLQVAGIFVFALPMFKGLDAEKKEHQVTWLAKTSTPQYR